MTLVTVALVLCMCIGTLPVSAGVPEAFAEEICQSIESEAQWESETAQETETVQELEIEQETETETEQTANPEENPQTEAAEEQNQESVTEYAAEIPETNAEEPEPEQEIENETVKTETFQEEPRDISGAEITLSVTVCTYNGLARKPSPAVVLQGEPLIKNTDYTVSYSNNINAGNAKVIIKGKGNYTGTCSTVFTINVRSITSIIKSTFVGTQILSVTKV